MSKGKQVYLTAKDISTLEFAIDIAEMDGVSDETIAALDKIRAKLEIVNE